MEATAGVGGDDVTEEGLFRGDTRVHAKAVEDLLQGGEQAEVGELG